MIGAAIEQMLIDGYDNDYMISSENVAHVMGDNTVLHAAMVLVKVGYNSIPVLDKNNKFLGTIGLADIMGSLFESDSFSNENFSNGIKVSDIMNTNVEALVYPFEVEDMMHELVNLNYIPIVSETNEFIGIVTRKEILKAFNYIAHDLEKEYQVTKK